MKRRGEGQREGTIRNRDGVKAAGFRVTYAAGDPSGILVRIEYRAKPYLKLVFEADEHAAVPPVKALFPEETE